MATADEMTVLNWFLAKHLELFPGFTAIPGTQEEDWAGMDAWLMKDGVRRFSIGVRRNADQPWERQFKLRVREGNVEENRFEFAKLIEGGGPELYLQAWGNSPETVSEYVFTSVKRMRASGCFDSDRRAEFWESETFHQTQTIWAVMDIEKLMSIGESVVLADVRNRRPLFSNEDLDFEIAVKGRVKRFIVGWEMGEGRTATET